MQYHMLHGLFESANEGNIAEYFIKFRGKTNQDINKKVLNATNEISERIITKIKEIQMGM